MTFAEQRASRKAAQARKTIRRIIRNGPRVPALNGPRCKKKQLRNYLTGVLRSEDRASERKHRAGLIKKAAAADRCCDCRWLATTRDRCERDQFVVRVSYGCPNFERDYSGNKK